MIYLFGASGHGLVILDILHRLQQPVQAFIDDADKPALWGGIPVIKTAAYINAAGNAWIISVGSNTARHNVAAKMNDIHFISAIHPAAIVASTVAIENGTVVMAGAILNPYAKVGKHCIINTGASIDHECELADFVHVSPHATLCGNVRVGNGAWIGAGATIIPGIEIGANAIVGAGAVVIRNVPEGAVVAGNPALSLR